METLLLVISGTGIFLVRLVPFHTLFIFVENIDITT